MPIKKTHIIEIKTGNVIASIAEPIKNTIIKYGPSVLSNYIKNCNCEKRKEWLNEHASITI